MAAVAIRVPVMYPVTEVLSSVCFKASFLQQDILVRERDASGRDVRSVWRGDVLGKVAGRLHPYERDPILKVINSGH